MSNDTLQYITFKLGDELFAIDVIHVREVLELTRITLVPTAPEYLRGMVNVRGKATPVADLRLRFGLPPQPDTVSSRILVMELSLGGEPTVLGGVADSVHEVIEFSPDQIDPPPKVASQWRTEFIRGIGRRGADFVIILDVNTLFSSHDVAFLEASK